MQSTYCFIIFKTNQNMKITSVWQVMILSWISTSKIPHYEFFVLLAMIFNLMFTSPNSLKCFYHNFPSIFSMNLPPNS